MTGAPNRAASLARSRALHYGDGVFRTLLQHRGQLIDLDGQLATLTADCERLGLAPPGRERLRRALGRATLGHRNGVIKLLAWRAGRARGYAPAARNSVLLALHYPLPQYPASLWRRGIRLVRSPVIVSEQPLLAGIKHLNRLESVLASQGWPPGVSEVIVADARGRPVGGSRSNVFWVDRGILCTPRVDRCGVAGRMRERVLAAAAGLGVPARIAALHWKDLIGADEIFVTNSVIGLWRVRELDGVGRTGDWPLTRQLAQVLGHPFQGRA